MWLFTLERTAALLALRHGEPQKSSTPLLVSQKKKRHLKHLQISSQCPELMNNSHYWMHLISQLFEKVLLERTFYYYSQLIRSYPPSHVFACWLLAGLVVVFNFQLVRTNENVFFGLLNALSGLLQTWNSTKILCTQRFHICVFSFYGTLPPLLSCFFFVPLTV